jgi:hypothetical protein
MLKLHGKKARLYASFLSTCQQNGSQLALSPVGHTITNIIQQQDDIIIEFTQTLTLHIHMQPENFDSNGLHKSCYNII